MNGVVLSLVASGAWGVSDYLGGVRTRTLSPAVVLLLSQIAGLVVLVAVVSSRGLLVAPSRLPGPALVAAAVAGAAGVASLGCLYLVMARGGVWLVAPVSALAAALPVVVGMAQGERLGARAGLGVVMALAGALCAGWPSVPAGGQVPSRRVDAATAGLALVSATCSAAFFVLIRSASQVADPAAVTVAGRASGAAVVIAWAIGRVRPSGDPVRTRTPSLRRLRGFLPGLAAVATIGAGDAVAEVCFASASTRAPLSVVTPLASLYPAVAVVLAFVLIRERLARIGVAGLVCALTGVLLLAG